MLVDSHCHLDFPDFAEERDEVVARARAAGVGLMVTICTRPSRIAETLAITERYPDVFCAVGVHPHEAAKEGDIAVERLVELARHPKVVGIGESGLDFHYDFSPRDRQEASFRTHARAARVTGLPLIVHTRSADADTLRVLRDEAAPGGLTGLIHCFSSGAELADGAVALGFMVSFSGILTFKASGEIRAVAARVPADRILVETDSPYLAPVPKRGKRNEPAFVAHTAARLAEVRGVDAPTLARQTTDNFHRLFAKVPVTVAA